MHRFVRNLITEWRRLKLPFDGERVIVAVSGGADSTALLLALAELRDRKKLTNELIVAHFNHKFRGQKSDADERFVKKLSKDHGLEFFSVCGGLIGHSNLEQRARNERYAFLTTVAVERRAAIVVTAHTINDQAETFLLNLIRGSGIDGLRAMPVKRQLEGDVILARPLLNWAARQYTVEFCNTNKIKFRQDAMNDDLNFTRVKIRRKVLPDLAKINPKIIETLARTAELVASSQSKSGDNLQNGPLETLSVKAARSLDENGLNTHIRSWLRERRGNLRGITLKHIGAVARLVNSPKSGRVVELPGGGRVVKGGGELAFRDIKLEY